MPKNANTLKTAFGRVSVLQKISKVMLSFEGEPGPFPKPTLMFLLFFLVMRIFKINIYFF